MQDVLVERVALRCARILDPGPRAHATCPSVVLYGRAGAPALVLVVGGPDGALRALRARFGDHVSFEHAAEEARVLH